MADKMSLKKDVPTLFDFPSAAQDVVFHCSDGLVVTANSLLLAVLSPRVRTLLESLEIEELFHVSYPELRAASLTSFLKDVYARDGDINVPEDVHSLLFYGWEQEYVVKLETDVKLEVEDNVQDNIMGLGQEDFVAEEELEPENIKLELQDDDNNWDLDEGVESKPKLKRRRILTKDEVLSTKKRYKPYHCGVCDIFYQHYDAMMKHVDVKHGPKRPPRCEECGKDMESASQLWKHKKRYHEDKVPCGKCGELYASVRMKEHYKRCLVKRREEKVDPKSCEFCGEIFTDSLKFSVHRRKHLKPHAPAKCELCGAVLVDKTGLNAHMLYVHGEKVTCQLCGKQVARMHQHMAEVHTKEENRTLKCEVCGKGFVHNGKLRDHMNIHLNLKPYKCREGCDMAYSDRSNRNVHEKKAHGVGGTPTKDDA